ncbi:MAG: ATP-binding protein, partial [Wenzhouxiangella sp.]
RKDKSTFLMELDIVPITSDSGRLTHWVSVQRDVTERHTMEQKLLQSERLKTVGQLTGGIAHDFNNLLTVIIGNAELMWERLQSDAALSAIAERINHAAQRGADLTNQLLAFARQQALEPRPVDLNRLVRDMNRLLLGRTLDNQIRIELTPDEVVCQAMVDPSQLQNALLNLCLNARDAMTEGGSLTIRTDLVWMDADSARRCDVDPGQYAVIEVADTGHGIAAEDLDKVIEPFYTTKEKGKGTGLGLSMVYGFVKQSRGHLAIDSEVGRGTTVTMLLPCPPEDATDVAQPAHNEPLEHGTESILLVEDDDEVRQFARQLMLSLGYNVQTASKGTEALSILEQDDEIDLLFTDVVMPGELNGKQLADRAMQIRPDLKVLYSSGYSADEISHDGQIAPGVLLLPKPYRRADLAHKLRETLDQRQSAPARPWRKAHE